jgi:signal transduction histidine kinase
MKDADMRFARLQDLSAVALRWVFIVGMAVIVHILRSRGDVPEVETNDLLIVSGIGVGASLPVIASIFLARLSRFTPYLLTVLDWGLASAYIYMAEADPLVIIAAVGFLAVVSLPNQPPATIGIRLFVLAALSIGMMIAFLGEETETINFEIISETYDITLVALLLFVVGGTAWSYAAYRLGGAHQIALDKMARSREKQMEAMQHRARSISEMTTMLASTLNYEKILEMALGIGDLSLRKENSQRVISLILMFRSDDQLYIADARGLKGGIEGRGVSYEEGIIADTLKDAEPKISDNPGKDPVLKDIPGFRSMRSVLCIPLRAHYENYGALVFGSSTQKAFNPDHIDTLNAVGLQATVALQNAVLYNNLLQEKERIIQMEEDARKDLVRDLHDVPTQTISSVAMRIRIAMKMIEKKQPGVMEELNEVEGQALKAVEEIRHVLFKLRPLALESQGLIAALDQLAEKMQTTYKQRVAIKMSPDVEEHLDETKQGTLFYLIEEAANNARKHAEADLISIQGIKKGNTLIVRIADNGKGFDTEAVYSNYDQRGSFGMVNLRERAELMEGTLTLKSIPGKGTTITVVIPIDYASLDGGNHRLSEIPTTRLAVAARRNLSRLSGGL